MASRKNLSVVLIIGGALLIIVVTFFIAISFNMKQTTTILQLGNGIFTAQLATTETERSKGLAGVTEFGSDKALLMIFPSEGKWGIWMKGMKTPIDVVWLNSDKKVIYAVTNISPELSILKEFSPKSPAKYVVELPAGTVKSKRITTGSIAIFNVDPTIGVR